VGQCGGPLASFWAGQGPPRAWSLPYQCPSAFQCPLGSSKGAFLMNIFSRVMVYTHYGLHPSSIPKGVNHNRFPLYASNRIVIGQQRQRGASNTAQPNLKADRATLFRGSGKCARNPDVCDSHRDKRNNSTVRFPWAVFLSAAIVSHGVLICTFTPFVFAALLSSSPSHTRQKERGQKTPSFTSIPTPPHPVNLQPTPSRTHTAGTGAPPSPARESGARSRHHSPRPAGCPAAPREPPSPPPA
jgi:hypothetical protein